MLILALTMCLAQVPEPAFESPLSPPPPPPPSASSLLEAKPVDEGSPALRSFITGSIAASAFATVVGGTVAYMNLNHSDRVEIETDTVMIAMPLAMVTGALAAMVSHKLQHGQGSLLSSMGGAAIGLAASAAVAWVLMSQPRDGKRDPAELASIGVMMAGAVGTGAAWSMESSNQRVLNDAHPQLSLAPIRGGAAANVSWTF